MIIGCCAVTLKAQPGTRSHAMACVAGYNNRWLMRAILRLGLEGLFCASHLDPAMAC